MLQPVCSMSKTANSEPASAAMRAMPVVLNSSIIVPIAIPPWLSVRLTLLTFIGFSSVSREDYLVSSLE